MCNAEMHNLKLRDVLGLLRFTDITSNNFEAVKGSPSTTDMMSLIHGLTIDGRWIVGVDVFRLAYRAVGMPWVTKIIQLPLVGKLADRIYPWVARNRYRLPRPLIVWLFEFGSRRAAQRAIKQHCEADATGLTQCQLPRHPVSIPTTSKGA